MEQQEVGGGFIMWELQNLFSSLDTNIGRIIESRRIKLSGHVARMGEKRSAIEDLVGKPEGRKPLGREYRWEIIIQIDRQL
jgi:hypothetical protein